MKQWIFVTIYLVSIVLANLFVTWWGINAVYLVAFGLVGLDLTARDFLHEFWKRGRWLKLGLLIGTGSLISWLINSEASKIAIASCVAFGSAAIIDTIIYHSLRKRAYLVKVNGSNLFSAFADSSIFLTLAFGGFAPILILKQFGCKLLGGFIWSLVLRRFRK